MTERYENIKETVITLVGTVAAAVSIKYQMISLFDPAIGQITGAVTECILKKSGKPEGFDADLQKCLKETIEKMMKSAPNQTIERALTSIQPSLEYSFSRSEHSEFNYDKLVKDIQMAVNHELRYGEAWLSIDEVCYINSVFLEEFGAQLYKYPALQGALAFQTVLQEGKKIDNVDQEVQQLKEKIQLLEHILNGEVVGELELAELLLEAYQEEQQNNPRFHANQVSSTLLPQLLSATLVKPDVRCPLPIGTFLQMYWNNNEQKHISLTGIGGIGKTTALLATEYTMPVVYVPLRNLADGKIGETEFIEKYIREITLHNRKEVFDAFIGLCNRKWNNGPSVVILLDGINEVEGDKRSSIFDEISHKWLRKSGLQLIITSRYDIRNDLVRNHCDHRFTHAQIQPLPRTVVEDYLKEHNIRLSLTSQIWDIINTPLMLMLYIRGEKAKEDYGSISRDWREAKNSGSIIWNYLLSEVVKLNNSEFGNGIFALFLLAPYICHKMMHNKVFSVTSDVFEMYLREAMTYYKDVIANDGLPTNIITELNRADAKIDLQKVKSYSLVVQKFGIFFEYHDTVKITHQHLRDCLAAIYMIHAADKAEELPQEWTVSFDVHVMEFVANLLETEPKRAGQLTTWQKVWNFEYQKGKNRDEFVHTMLEIYQHAYGMDLSEVNFSGVDLRNIPLVSYRLSSKSQNHFIGTVLGKKTFFGDGHADQVSGVSWSQDEQQYMSASYDCTIRLYRNSDHSTIVQLQERELHKHYIRCAEFSPAAAERIASAGDDKELVVWDKEGTNWRGKVWGTLDGWIRRLAWDSCGKRIACGDGDGCIALFTGEGKKKVFTDRHNGNVTALAWAANKKGIFASGGQDGDVMIWDDEGYCKSKLRMASPVNSLGWLHDDNSLLVATSKGIYFYAVNPETLEMKLRKSVESEYEISCVTTAAKKGVADYLAIFNDSGVVIQSVRQYGEQIALVSLASYEYRGIINCVVAAKWNKACDKLVCGARDGSVIRIDLNERELDEERITFQIIGKRCGKAARCSAWSNNKKYIAVGYDDARIRIWDVFSKCCIQVLHGHSDSIKCLAWSTDDKKLAAGSDDTKITVWERDKPDPKMIAIHHGPVNAMVWLDDEIIISAGDDMLLTVTNTTTGDTIRKQGHQKKIYSLSLSEDRKRLASCGNDKDILIWNTASWGHRVVVNDAHKEPIRAVAWYKDVILTSSNDKTLKLWRVGSNRIKHIRTLVGFKDFVYGANLSENGRYAIGGCTDSTVGFWDVGNKKPLYISNAHGNFVWHVSVREQYVATSSSDGTVRVWDVSEGNVNSNLNASAILEVIPESDIVGCDFRGAIMDEDLKQLLKANGGVVDKG